MNPLMITLIAVKLTLILFFIDVDSMKSKLYEWLKPIEEVNINKFEEEVNFPQLKVFSSELEVVGESEASAEVDDIDVSDIFQEPNHQNKPIFELKQAGNQNDNEEGDVDGAEVLKASAESQEVLSRISRLLE